jgi:hypothetical protein
VQTLSQRRTVTLRGELLQEICRKAADLLFPDSRARNIFWRFAAKNRPALESGYSRELPQNLKHNAGLARPSDDSCTKYVSRIVKNEAGRRRISVLDGETPENLMCVSAANLGFEFEYGSAIVRTPEDGGAIDVASRIEDDPRQRPSTRSTG